MGISIISVGSKMPSWVEEGFGEYAKRLPHELKITSIVLPLATRSKTGTAAQWKAKEAVAILKAIPAQSHIIVLDERGDSFTTQQLAHNIVQWQQRSHTLCFIIGGPDGLDNTVLAKAHARWSLSPLTLPHPLVRIILVEQVYRAWTLLQDHPYHRA